MLQLCQIICLQVSFSLYLQIIIVTKLHVFYNDTSDKCFWWSSLVLWFVEWCASFLMAQCPMHKGPRFGLLLVVKHVMAITILLFQAYHDSHFIYIQLYLVLLRNKTIKCQPFIFHFLCVISSSNIFDENFVFLIQHMGVTSTL